MGAILGGIMILWLAMFAIGVAGFAFWVWMLTTAIKNDYGHKPIWILVILIGNLLGAIAFYFSVYKGIKSSKEPISSK